MHEFPDDHELIGLFEVEPTVLDAGVPWRYNTLDFITTRNGIEVHARIMPAYGDLTLRLISGEQELVLFDLREASGFRVIMDKQREALVATFAPQRKLREFVLQLKPRVLVAWGNLSSG